MNFFREIIYNIRELYDEFIKRYPSAAKTNFSYIFGALVVIFLIVLALTGLFLNKYYVARPNVTFDSVKIIIMLNVYGGSLVRYIHMNATSFLFLFLYIHLAVNLFKRSYKVSKASGFGTVLSLFFLLCSAFFGSVLPSTQLNFWAASAVADFLHKIPYIGPVLVKGFGLGEAVNPKSIRQMHTGHRFFAYLGAAAAFMSFEKIRTIGFTRSLKWPYETHKKYRPIVNFLSKYDFFIFFVVFCVFVSIVIYFPLFLTNADQFVRVNAILRPTHISPEWYLAPFYSIVYSAFYANGGFVLLLTSFFLLSLLPFFDLAPEFLPKKYKIYFDVLNCIFLFSFLALGYIGFMPLVFSSMFLSKIFTAIYLCYFTILFFLSAWVRADCKKNELSKK